MHELPVTQSVLEIALNHAASARRITDIYLVVGQLASFVDDSIQFFWDMISEDTIAQGAQLHFRREPAVMQCYDCGHRYYLGGDFSCPNCSSDMVAVESGEEFYIESIEVEMEEDIYSS
ncbi:MAG TPA: hydrogenase maturation nickel metallochaperone HypA [Phototrophicaceae bacterium]|nr:hydrogenase maturation nickel metallochaperone HypA [Phototrophicaceae bacterium]